MLVYKSQKNCHSLQVIAISQRSVIINKALWTANNILFTSCLRMAFSIEWLLTSDAGLQANYSSVFQSISRLFLLMFKDDKMSFCFLHLIDVSIHKQRKTQASWVSATDSYGEKTLPDLISRHSNDYHTLGAALNGCPLLQILNTRRAQIPWNTILGFTVHITYLSLS